VAKNSLVIVCTSLFWQFLLGFFVVKFLHRLRYILDVFLQYFTSTQSTYDLSNTSTQKSTCHIGYGSKILGVEALHGNQAGTGGSGLSIVLPPIWQYKHSPATRSKWDILI
jgi:hypothetical protein